MTLEDSPPDDSSIENSATLLRRLHPSWMQKDASGAPRLASNAYHDLTDDHGVSAMSVFVEGRLLELNRSAADLVDGREGWGVVAISAAFVRDCGLTIVWAASDRDGIDGQAHAHVFGKKTGSIQKKLVAASQRRVWPSA